MALLNEAAARHLARAEELEAAAEVAGTPRRAATLFGRAVAERARAERVLARASGLPSEYAIVAS